MLSAKNAPSAALAASTVESTSTDYLSDDAWRKLPREERRRRSRAEYVARFEPGGVGRPERLADYVERYGRTNIYDLRLHVYNVRAELEPGTTGSVILRGEVSLPQYADGIQETLTLLGFNIVRSEIAVLPDEALGPDRFALATTAAATVRKEPRPQAEQVTSVAMGNWVRLLRESRPSDIVTTFTHWSGRAAVSGQGPAARWYLAQTSEGYLGYMRDDELSRTAQLQLPDAMVLVPTTVTLQAKNGAASAEIAVPAGAFVVRTGGRSGESGEAGVSAASGVSRTGARYRLPHAGVELPATARVVELGRSPFTADEILELAKPLMGVRYVWGGVTGEGIDCSGFTQFMLRTRGITLPRDAEEQATVGQIVAFGEDVEQLAQPGDLIFFCNDRGKISHIAMSLGHGRIIHSADTNVHLSHLRDPKPDTGEPMIRNVVFARRVQGR